MYWRLPLALSHTFSTLLPCAAGRSLGIGCSLRQPAEILAVTSPRLGGEAVLFAIQSDLQSVGVN